jgi:hypothetical protein
MSMTIGLTLPSRGALPGLYTAPGGPVPAPDGGLDMRGPCRIARARHRHS